MVPLRGADADTDTDTDFDTDARDDMVRFGVVAIDASTRRLARRRRCRSRRDADAQVASGQEISTWFGRGGAGRKQVATVARGR